MPRRCRVLVAFGIIVFLGVGAPSMGQLIPRTPPPSVFHADVLTAAPACPDPAELYAQCPTFTRNGSEDEFYARSDVEVDTSGADNFTLQTQRTIRRIRWWGTYLISNAGCGAFPDDFAVRFWRDAQGDPIGPDALPTPAYTVIRSSETVGEIPAALGGAPIFEYDLTFEHGGFQAQPFETYWLEIQNDQTVSGGCYWVWVTAPIAPGDGTSRQRSPTTDPTWSAPTTRGFDLAFSLFDRTGEPIPAVSGWGLLITTLALLAGGVFVIRRRGIDLERAIGL